MANLLQLIVSGLSLGAVYALVALGFVVIYRASQVFNFAQAEFLTVGAFLVVTFGEFGLPWVLALLAAMVSGACPDSCSQRAVTASSNSCAATVFST